MKPIKTYEVSYSSVVIESFEVEAENEEIAIARGKQLFLNAMQWSDGDQDISFYNIEEININQPVKENNIVSN
tara:strand:- start:387 stop:605 length:219 start_codon:yes stop_codon:yes gene_type:complete